MITVGAMRARGIAYSTGFVVHGRNSVEVFDAEMVRRDLTVIRDELHCNAVHLVGGDPDRLETAARLAAELGLEIWFSPYPLELEPDEILDLFADCAVRAERIRAGGAEVVFVAGVELSVMNRGFADGDSAMDRVGFLFGAPDRIPVVRERLDAFLRDAVRTVRERFGGRVTYAAIQFEGVDWELFDIVTYELIRSAAVADMFPAAVRSLTAPPQHPFKTPLRRPRSSTPRNSRARSRSASGSPQADRPGCPGRSSRRWPG